jgi:hypothetical protein
MDYGSFTLGGLLMQNLSTPVRLAALLVVSGYALYPPIERVGPGR